MFSIILRWRTQQTHVCFQLGLSAGQPEPMSKTRLVLLLCNVLYCVSYHDNCIRISIILWENVALQAYYLQELFFKVYLAFIWICI